MFITIGFGIGDSLIFSLQQYGMPVGLIHHYPIGELSLA
jgi:hypothetical protein